DEHDDREVELLQLAEAPEAADRFEALVLAEHLDGELLDMLELDALLAPALQTHLDPLRQLVGAAERHPDCHERTRHQPLGIRLVRRPERQRLAVARVAHARTPVPTSRRIASSRLGSPPSETTSLSAKTTSTPRSWAASATTSIAAALISTRNTSASTPTRSRR